MIETKIRLLLEQRELTYLQIAVKLKTTKRIVEKVKHKGKWYIDLDSGERVVSCKNISKEQQICVSIYNKIKSWESNINIFTPEDKLSITKSLNVRLATWLGVNDREVRRWMKKDRLVEESLLGSEMSYVIDFFNSRDKIMREYIQDSYFIKAHKLNYINYGLKSGFAHYINNHCQRYYGFTGSEEEYLKRMVESNVGENVYLTIMSAKAGIQLSKWCSRKIEEGYTFKECMECLRSGEYYTEFYYEGDLQPPFVIYYETRGFIILPDELKNKILTQLDGGEIAGTFDYNPMLREIYKSEYG